MPDFQNPQQDPGMERRLLLVFILTFLVILLFQPVLKKYLPQSTTPASETKRQEQPPAAPAAASKPASAPKTKPRVTAPTTAKQAGAESTIVVDNDLYRITFTNRGAQVKSWILKKFKDEKGQPLELVNSTASEKYGYPLSLWTYDETQRNKLNSALYVSSSPGTVQVPAEITFEYADQDVAVRKTFRFDHTYVVQVETSVSSGGSNVTALPMWPAGFGDQVSPSAYASGKIEYQFNSSIERLAIKKISSGNTLHGPFDWAGPSDQYFAAVFVPESPENAAMVTLRNVLDIPKDPQKPQETTKAEVLGAAVGNPNGPTVERVFVGPKSLSVLESVRVPAISGAEGDLRALVDFGWWGVLARPLFVWLRWTYEAKYIGVHNWGWAIVVQTLIINLVLMPLRISQTKYALKMQKIQPQIKAIQERYKKYGMRDPRKQEMQKEIFALQQKEGVSMWGGCLPVLVQFPFLIAYYRMLGVAIDLRQAPWLWIHDLSSRDPYYLLPILIILTGLVMQRMTPQAGIDPSQQKMMNVMMPVFFGIISFNLAAGLCLYWCESSLIGILQQMALNRTSMGREMREIAAKRARKKEKKQ